MLAWKNVQPPSKAPVSSCFQKSAGLSSVLCKNSAWKPCTIAGDTNHDCAVDFADLNQVLADYGSTGAGLAGDVNGDGIVSFPDLNIVLSNFGARG